MEISGQSVYVDAASWLSIALKTPTGYVNDRCPELQAPATSLSLSLVLLAIASCFVQWIEPATGTVIPDQVSVFCLWKGLHTVC